MSLMENFVPEPWSQGSETRVTAVLVLADGTVFEGYGIGAVGDAVGEVCFNTAMTGYEEILTDPSYADQIITFTFPHIGNVGVNDEDQESDKPVAKGIILRETITAPSNYRAQSDLGAWLERQGIIGISGVDTRALTRLIRDKGMPHGVICNNPDGKFDIAALTKKAAGWPGLEDADLAVTVSRREKTEWDATRWEWDKGYGRQAAARHHIVAIDYGVKRNILRCFANSGCHVSVVPATATAEEILALNPDGIFLSNGPGDPAATARHASPVIRALIDAGKPIFGICLGHQLLAHALGIPTRKMPQGHHGANHPVKDLQTGKVEITSMNHGFTVDRDDLPAGVVETHISLFDGTNCGIAVTGKPIFSVQYHPEASPGPQDSHYLFDRFVALLD